MRNPIGKPLPTTAPHLAETQQPWRGISLLLAAVLLLACMDATTKFLTTQYDVPMIAAMRYIVHCSLMIIILAPSQGKRLIKTQRTGWVIVRGASLVIATLFIGLALQRMPIAETTSIIFLSPLIVVLLARPLLGEHIGALGWVAVIMGLIGTLLIVRPTSGLDTLGVIYALGAAVATVVYQLLSRMLASSEHTISLLFYAALIGAFSFGLSLPWFWQGIQPSWQDYLLFISIGIYGGLGHFLFTAAYQHAPASVLAPMNYVQLLWAGLLGWLVFQHIPDQLSLLGMTVVAASGVLVVLKSRLPRLQTASTDLA
ncbi:DMT family transporter [Beggiatoa leptomitoformis]|uniref:EamA family transporter n=1 Tax=Beggiatoa leptomitoformis TaxID=288004 RepID=A0A2N9YJG4_9GAMM|nr:DMT family transporter [Beggiatoa leptomitoformis]ALG69467.2 EamA family transporter [Beggiatoa leptomitoformis]AUI70624.2 EamA family transporter [Beggiatoa leptomitoformis]